MRQIYKRLAFSVKAAASEAVINESIGPGEMSAPLPETVVGRDIGRGNTVSGAESAHGIAKGS